MFVMYRSSLAASIRQNSELRLVRICRSHVWSKWCAGEGGVRPAVEALPLPLPLPTPLLPWPRTGRPRSSTSPANGSVGLMQVLRVIGSYDRACLFWWGEKDIDEFDIKNQKQCSLLILDIFSSSTKSISPVTTLIMAVKKLLHEKDDVQWEVKPQKISKMRLGQMDPRLACSGPMSTFSYDSHPVSRWQFSITLEV